MANKHIKKSLIDPYRKLDGFERCVMDAYLNAEFKTSEKHTLPKGTRELTRTLVLEMYGIEGVIDTLDLTDHPETGIYATCNMEHPVPPYLPSKKAGRAKPNPAPRAQ